MNRRNFTYTFLGSMITMGISPNKVLVIKEKKPKLIKPAKLKKGDRVGLISPGSPITEEKLENAKKNMLSLGLIPVIGDHVMAEYGYLAGSDEKRLADIHRMFSDPEIKAVWAIRGGYGCTRILDMVNYELIKNNPKQFIGYSDLTALHLAIHKKTGLVCTHGPVAGTLFSDYTLKRIKTLLFKSKGERIKQSKENKKVGNTQALYKSETLKMGKVKGILTGGNLSLLASLAGTDFAPDYEGKLVFIEDVGEKPYRVDRMLTQLIQSGNLLKARGIILGVFAGCNPDKGDKSLSLIQCFEDRFSSFEGPVVYGFPFGHIKNQCSFPYGLKGELDTESFSVKLSH